ncbi:MAG: HAD-IB family hydrolase [Deltaproteobacteria bacterium]|jgi:HAD superfamily hydrolase (TIGR01490 family)
MGERKAAAFFDMDGTLVSTNLVHSYLFMAAHEPSIAGSVVSTAKGLAKIPAFFAVDQFSRLAFNDLLFAGYAGSYEDRLIDYAEDHFEKVLKPNIFPGSYDLVANGKKKGLRQVIVSGSLDFMVAPLARHLGIDDIITNRLEMKNGVATGKLLKPIVAGANKARIIQEYARDYDIDLLDSYGFSDSYSDYSMLAVVGRPAAVNPDRRLRRSAKELNWPILDVR